MQVFDLTKKWILDGFGIFVGYVIMYITFPVHRAVGALRFPTQAQSQTYRFLSGRTASLFFNDTSNLTWVPSQGFSSFFSASFVTAASGQHRTRNQQ